MSSLTANSTWMLKRGHLRSSKSWPSPENLMFEILYFSLLFHWKTKRSIEGANDNDTIPPNKKELSGVMIASYKKLNLFQVLSTILSDYLTLQISWFGPPQTSSVTKNPDSSGGRRDPRIFRNVADLSFF